jgi:hypothetical protein
MNQALGFKNARFVGADTFIEQDRPVDRFDHIQKGNFSWLTRQRYTTARTARGVKQAGNGQLGDDLGKERGWDLHFPGNSGGGDTLFRTLFGKVTDGADGIVSLTCDLHWKTFPKNKVIFIFLYCIVRAKGAQVMEVMLEI